MATVRTLIGNIKGPKGDTGATGATGPQGPGATIEVGTVSTTAYGNPVQITNSGTETDAVLDFVIPQGKPGEQTTKMSLLTLDTITTQTAEYPIPAVGDVGSTAWGKIVKFFNDIKTAVTGKVDKTSIVNNLTSTVTDAPLSAAQGKALNDAKADKTTVNAISGRFISYIYNSSTSGIAIKEIIRILLAMIHNEGLADFTTKRTYPVFLELTGPSAVTLVGYIGISPTAMRFLLSTGAGTDVYHGIFTISDHQVAQLYKISGTLIS